VSGSKLRRKEQSNFRKDIILVAGQLILSSEMGFTVKQVFVNTALEG
jgi:hypothetical protein